MKKTLLLACTIALTLTSAFCGTVTLQWDQNTEPDIAQYDLYRSVNGGGFVSTVVPFPTHQFTYIDIAIGNSYQFFVTAVNTNALESPNSVLVSFTPPPLLPPLNVQKVTVSGVAGANWTGAQVFFDTINLASFQASNYVITATSVGFPTQTLTATNSPAVFPILPIHDYTFSVSASNASGTSPTGATVFKSGQKPASVTNFKVQTGP